VFKDQRFGLGMSDRNVDFGNISNECACLLTVDFFTKVTRKALLEVFGFSDVNNNSLGVVHSVHAGLMSYCLEKGSRIKRRIHTKASQCPAFRDESLSVLTQRRH
jgi:hypothetical protein